GGTRLSGGTRGQGRTAAGARSGLPDRASAALLSGADGVSRFELRAPFGRDLTGPVGQLVNRRGWELLELHESRFSLEDTFIALTKQAGGHREVNHV
ncbi:hypothetical protein H8E07_19790, partial [bacterium]|nr:hypothetical protein [bacterium]